MFDNGGMTAAHRVEPDPDDHAYWDAVLPVPDSTLDDDGPDLTLADIAALTDRLDDPPDDEVDSDDGEWAIPGVSAHDREDGGGLSRTSRAVLAEVVAAARAMRIGGARLYRAINALRDSDAVAETGYRNLARLLEDHIRLDPSHVKRLAVHATALRPTTSPSGTPTPAVLPATAARVDDGDLGSEHVQIIERTITRLRALPDDAGITDDVIDTTEHELAKLAATRSPAALQRAATGILARLDTDGAAPDDSTPPDNELHLRERNNGALEGKFACRDPASAAQLIAALAAATPPAESAALADADGHGPTGPHGEHGESPGANALRTLPARRAQALLDLAAEAHTRGLNIDDDHDGPASEPGTAGTGAADTRHDSDEGRDDAEFDFGTASEPENDRETSPEPNSDTGSEPPPKAPKPATTPPWRRPDYEGGERIALTLTVGLDTLRTQLGEKVTSLALLGENTWIRPETARRLACDADIIPAVLGTASEVLDLGRKARTANIALRRALTLRDRHCAHPGCLRRPRKCHAHHIQHWIDGGETEPENCVLLCSYHHTLVHHSGWEIVMIDGLPWFRPPAWLDPNRQLRHNRPWQVAA